jgi:zinc transporter ZupT
MTPPSEPEPEQKTSVLVILLASMFCGPLGWMMAWNAGYFHRNGKVDPMNLGFALAVMALIVWMVVAVIVHS